jgi:hypothetical protein
MPFGTLQSLLGAPELSSWLTLAERDSATAAQRSRVEDPLAHALGLVVLPDLAAHLPAGQPVTFDAATDEDGCLTLRRAGLRLLFPDRPRRVAMRVADHTLGGLSPHESVPLSTTSTGVIVTTEWSDWLARVAPGSGPGRAVRRTADWAERLEEAVTVASLVDEPTLGLIPWVILRAQAPGHRRSERPVPDMPGLLVLDVDNAARWPLDLASARVRAEFDLIAGAYPLFEDEPTSAHAKTANQALRRQYLRGRLREAGILPAGLGADARDASLDWESARLTSWGRAVLTRAAGCQ